jgi:hypothetical protein
MKLESVLYYLVIILIKHSLNDRTPSGVQVGGNPQASTLSGFLEKSELKREGNISVITLKNWKYF